MTILRTIIGTCLSIHNNRTCADVLASTAEELGELGKEVRIKYGTSYKTEGPDGILGEAVDLLINTIDMIVTDDPSITPEAIEEKVKQKLEKWVSSEQQHKSTSDGSN